MKFIFALSLLVTLSACGGRSKPDRVNEPVAPSETATAQAAAADAGPIAPTDPVDPNTTIGATIPAATTDVTVTPEVPYAEENTEFVGNVAQQVLNQKNAPAEKPASAAAAVKNPQADKVLGWLKNGNTRFVKRKFRADGQGPADRTRLLSGQNPHAIVFTCSDSRVPPELIFDQKLGEIYVIRNDELTTSEDALKSIEKGAATGAQLLVVLSYEGCTSDAVKTSDRLSSLAGRVKVQHATYDLKSGVVKFE